MNETTATMHDSQAGAANAARRWLQPQVLSRLGNLELIARSVVDGVLTGLHRSPHFGFSQEFAEYRAYNEGDDLRFVDWNVYARTDRTYIKRFRGDTNTSLTLLVDASGSMGYGSVPLDSQSSQSSNSNDSRSNRRNRSATTGSTLSKYDYARYLAASLAYLASKQHDANGLVLFDEEIRHVLQPSSRPDSLPRLFATLESSEASQGTDVETALESIHTVASRRGLVALISDLYTDPEQLMKTLQPLAHRQQDIVLFHLLDPMELNPEYDSVVSLTDLETGERTDVDPDWMKTDYRELISAHCEALEKATQRVGADYIRLATDAPLDDALTRYLLFRQRKQ